MNGRSWHTPSGKPGPATQDRAWLCMKLSFVVLAAVFLLYVLYNRSGQPFPSGICRWVDCSRLTAAPIRLLVTGVLLVMAVLYVLERHMRWVTLVLGLLSVFIFSLEESNGNPAKNGLISLSFLAQSLAYWLYGDASSGQLLALRRVQFPAQIFAAAYTLAAISKLQVSGLHWFTDDSPKFALEVLRVHMSRYATSGLPADEARGYFVAGFIQNHPLFTQLFLGMALLIELGAFCLLLNRRVATVYTLLVLCMHIGFYVTLHIFFPTIILPVVVILLNPLYLLIKPFLKPTETGKPEA